MDHPLNMYRKLFLQNKRIVNYKL